MNFHDLYDIFDEVDNEPYPKIEEIKQNYNLGRKLYDVYSGNYGELTSILQYTYEGMTNEKDLKKILQRIAIDEMKHLKVLGEILVELGFIPFYMGSRNNKWCSDNVKYKFKSVYEMLEYNIESEKYAIKEYKKLIEITDCKCIKETIERIIKDEENHVRILKAIWHEYKKPIKKEDKKCN